MDCFNGMEGVLVERLRPSLVLYFTLWFLEVIKILFLLWILLLSREG